jgi:hypothetical protein
MFTLTLADTRAVATTLSESSPVQVNVPPLTVFVLEPRPPNELDENELENMPFTEARSPHGVGLLWQPATG